MRYRQDCSNGINGEAIVMAKRRTATPQTAFVVVVVTGIVGTSAACGGPECEEKVEIVDHTRWRLLGPDEDVFPAPPGTELCTEANIRMEPFGDAGPIAVDIDTATGCGWATVEQETNAELVRGDSLQLRMFYFSQTVFPEAEATVIVAFDGEPVWSVQIPIPTSTGLEAPVVPIDRDLAAGTKVQFHVGNHGDNSWNLLEVSRTRPILCPL